MSSATKVITLLEERGTMSQDQFLASSESIIESFSSYMASLGDTVAAAPLSNPEKALLRTFLVALVREKI